MPLLYAGRPFPLPGGRPIDTVLAASEAALLIDLERCIGCFACEMHCKLEHRPSPGIRRLRLLPIEGEAFSTSFVPLACAHCVDPPCGAVCPVRAIVKDPDGVVRIQESRCMGCLLCATVCPYGVVEYDLERACAVKCDGCRERLDHGLWPACATKCSMKAMHFGSEPDLARVLQEKRVRRAGAACLGVPVTEP